MRCSDFAPVNTCWIALALFLIIGDGSSSLCFSQQPVVKRHGIAVSTHQFTLESDGHDFFLQRLPLAAKQSKIPILRDWLIPAHNVEDEDDDPDPVNSFNYDRHVTSFPIGNGQIGLRISSFDAMTEGSMAAAAGRDVFLIYDPRVGKLQAGGFDLGVTKERYRVDGCFHAQMTHLLVADANQDGLVDIGVIKEEIWCPEIGSEDDISDEQPGEHKKLPSELTNIVETHLYQQHNAAWYVYTPQGWKLDSEQTGIPDTFSELPLVGIVLSPVDFVGEVLWRSLDPKSWMDRPLYVPTYRKKLMAQEASGFKKSRNPLKFEKGNGR